MSQVYDMGWRERWCGENFMTYFQKHYESFDGCVDWITSILTWLFVVTLLLCTPFAYITVQVLFSAGWPARKAEDDLDFDEEAVTTERDPLAQRNNRDALLNTNSDMSDHTTQNQSVTAV